MLDLLSDLQLINQAVGEVEGVREDWDKEDKEDKEDKGDKRDEGDKGDKEDVETVPSVKQNTLVESDSLPSLDLPEDTTEQLQVLLFELVMSGRNYSLKQIEEKLAHLEYELHDPQELINLLLPLIAELLSLKVAESKDEVIEAIVPIIDQVIGEKSQQDKIAMIKALSSVIPGAISKQISDSPEEITQAIAPAMGNAIKEQIRLERDSMVDALYPVIGNTIAKYMGEVVKEINQKVENTLSVEGVKRKIRAKVQGVSEAELILRESMPFTIQAVFLIHKASGLVMSEAQKSNSEKLESDMLAGMLTAIRSFASECTIEPGNTSELTEIDYDNFKITIEVAGYCYLAVITEGETTQSFIAKVRKTLSTIILNYGYSNAIEDFNGDPETIPLPVHQLLEDLINYSFQENQENKKRHQPFALLILVLVLLSIIFLPLGFYLYRQRSDRSFENTAISALSSTPELAVYRLEADVKGKTLELTGKLPNEYLRQKAETVVATAIPNISLENNIIAVDVPPDPVLIAAEVERLTILFNQMDNVIIATNYADNRILVTGHIRQVTDIENITQAFKNVPGVQSVVITIQPQAFPIDQRLYFQADSASLNSVDIREKIIPIVEFLEQYPDMELKIIGHTDIKGGEGRNNQLAQQRAETVKKILETQGIASQRLLVEAIGKPPPNINNNQLLWLSRCVRFERIKPKAKNK